MESKPRGRSEESSAFLVDLISRNVLDIDAEMSVFLSEKAPFLESKTPSDYFDRCFDCDLLVPGTLGGYEGRIDHAEKGEEWYSVIYIHNPPDLFVNGQPIKEIEFKTPFYTYSKKGGNKLDPKNKFHLSLTSHALPSELRNIDSVFVLDVYQFLFDNNGKPNNKFIVQHGTLLEGFDINTEDFELIAPVTQILLNFMQNAVPLQESLK